MKKVSIVLVALFITACGGSLSDEQRKQMREASEQQAILKVTEAEITEAAFAKGRSVMTRLVNNPDTAKVSAEDKVKINWLAPGTTRGLEIERQLIEAYLASLISGSALQDNVQEIGTDSLLYTNPVVITRADSSIEIKGTWNIWISRRDLVLSMNKK